MTSTGRSLSDSLTALPKSLKRTRGIDEHMSLSERRNAIVEVFPRFVQPAAKRLRLDDAIKQSAEDGSGEPDNKKRTKESANTHGNESIVTEIPVTLKQRKNPHTHDLLKQLLQQKEKLKEDLERIEKKRRFIFSNQTHLWSVYKYGLDKISQLTDLQDAPDAILPGNF